MSTATVPTMRVEDARKPLWLAGLPKSWGNVVRTMPFHPRNAAEAIAGAGLGWTVEQHPLEAVIGEGDDARRIPVPRFVANGAPTTAGCSGSSVRATSRCRTPPRSRSAMR